MFLMLSSFINTISEFQSSFLVLHPYCLGNSRIVHDRSMSIVSATSVQEILPNQNHLARISWKLSRAGWEKLEDVKARNEKFSSDFFYDRRPDTLFGAGWLSIHITDAILVRRISRRDYFFNRRGKQHWTQWTLASSPWKLLFNCPSSQVAFRMQMPNGSRRIANEFHA